MNATRDALEPVEEQLGRARSLSALLRFALADKQSAGFDPEVRFGCYLVACDVEDVVSKALDDVEEARR